MPLPRRFGRSYFAESLGHLLPLHGLRDVGVGLELANDLFFAQREAPIPASRRDCPQQTLEHILANWLFGHDRAPRQHAVIHDFAEANRLADTAALFMALDGGWPADYNA